MLKTFVFNFFNVTLCDAAESWQIGLQDPASPAMEGMINFHNYIMIFFNFYWDFCFMDVI